VGRVSFTPQQLADNANEVLDTLVRMKPSTAKGIYLKTISVASTMSPGIPVDTKSIR
jgi:large subunit ribosomal protein L1